MLLEPYRDHDLFLDFLHVTRERGGGDLFAGMKLALVGTQYERPLPSPVGIAKRKLRNERPCNLLV